MDKYVGKRLDGRYEIQELIGYGGMAIVYKAFDTVEDKIVAIKILKEEFLDNKDFIRRFKNESKAIAVLSHKNIVKVFDVSFGDLIQYIVMEYIDGITLKDYIKQQQKISWQDAVHFTTQILQALNHAHSKGIIHRDIKPQNIMLLQDGTIKVTDFGIARFSHNDTRTMTDKAIGSVHYISPEQARGDVTDEKADIYSVGVMLYEMLTGKLPFEADNAVSVAIMQMQSNPKPPRKIDENIPEGLEDITLKAMQKEPMNRYLSASLMLEAIEEFKRNPSIRFEYKYLTDDSPTKYVDAIKNTRSLNSYGDNYDINEPSQSNTGGLSSKRVKSKYLKSIIWVGVAVIALATMFGVYAFSKLFNSDNEDVDVPNFIGLKLSSVQNNPSYKFTFKIEKVYDANEAEGIIVDQDPKAGSKKVKEKSTITLMVNSSETSIVIPTVKGTTEEIAKKRLKEAGLSYEVMYVASNETAAGIVLDSSPKEGTTTFASIPVKLLVSKGPEEKKVVVPDVISKNVQKAISELTSKGLSASMENVEYRESSQQQKDIVISTDPLPNTEVEEGTTVTLVVGAGPKEDKSVEIKIDLPSFVDHEVSMIVLVDNIVNGEHTKKIIPSLISNGIYRMTLKGKTGKVSVAVKLDGKLYRNYEVDFDSGSYKNTGSYEFEENKSSSSNIPLSTQNNTTTEKSSNNSSNLIDGI